MKEQLIDFETAKLAKEKGFDIPCQNKYRKGGTLSDGKGFMSVLDMCNAPTQSLLQKWLREKHGIHVDLTPTPNLGEWFYSIEEIYNSSKGHIQDDNSKTFEQALEKGLIESLKLIK